MRTDRRSAIAALVLVGALGGCNPVLGPTPVDPNWHVIDTTHFSFNVRPGSFAEQNVARLNEVVEDQYAYTQRVLDIRYGGRISLFLYNSAADAGMMGERSGKAYPDTEAVIATAGPPLDDYLYVVLSHELNHVIEDNAIGPPATNFMREGLPSAVLSERYHSQGRTFLYSWTKANLAQIPALTNIVDDGKWHDYPEQVVYNASASFLSYLVETEGPQKLKQLQPVTSAAFDRRFKEIYGRSLSDAEAAWRAFCAVTISAAPHVTEQRLTNRSLRN